ncbi:MAG: hypothetical protein IKD79_02805 [Oscillospiraceae bacterium]|nr:hypothetical protein [Oscillospiraceae bacterium]
MNRTGQFFEDTTGDIPKTSRLTREKTAEMKESRQMIYHTEVLAGGNFEKTTDLREMRREASCNPS